MRSAILTASAFLLLAARLHAQADPTPQPTPGDRATLPVVTGQLEVTTTPVPEPVEPAAAEITVITADEMAARGVHDVAGALALVGGVAVAPGGEAGPAGFVPELWGLREIDAFLVVVDGVPWGGAFNPAVAALDLVDIERIEVLRGAAPVMFGATAFSGVIHVIHNQAGAGNRQASVWGGKFSSGGASARLPLPQVGDFRQSLSIDGEKDGYADNRAELERGHVLYRASTPGAGGVWRLDADALIQRQKPTSPHARGNAVTILNPRIPLDANHNPTDAKLDEDRFHLVGGYERPVAGGNWSTTVSFTHSKRDNVRGFIRRDDISSDPDVEADGFRQGVNLNDAYFDSHLAWDVSDALKVVVGFDELYGKGKEESDNFEYEVGLDGEGAPNSHSLHIDESTKVEDSRNFMGLYGQAQWQPTERWQVTGGLRLNRTHEKRDAGVTTSEGDREAFGDSKTLTRTSGVVGTSWRAWGSDQDGIWVFGDYRRSFKPAALDFGPEADGSAILDPETSKSAEVGIKGALASAGVRWQLTAFDMRLQNLLVAVTRGGLPAIANGGKQRFKGIELEASWRLFGDLTWYGAASHHDSHFEDFVQIFDDVPTQLRGKKLELAPEDLASSALVWAPAEGFNAHLRVESVSERFLSRRNTVLAPAYTEWDGGIGYRFATWELRLDGDNLSDTRPAVSESELGDAQ
ncbi:MAG TPA: TonB-dependent receptor, partial [Thermoanaerobaculia bacterium]|nr:TonB-dependent receptor [Thermoanaerobaculia bacterium]